MNIILSVKWDSEASVYYSVCDEIGLGIESDSYDSLIQRVRDAVHELLELNNIQGCTAMCFRDYGSVGRRHCTYRMNAQITNIPLA